MNGIMTVARKELARVFGDKKLVFSLFIMPALLMFVLYSLMGKAIGGMIDDIEEHVPNVVIQNAPEGLDSVINTLPVKANLSYLQETDSLEDTKAAIKSGDVELLIVFPKDFLQEVSAYAEGAAVPEVKTFYNPAEDYSSEARSSYGEALLGAYRQTLLQARIGNLDQLTVFSVDLDQSTSIITEEGKAGGKMLSMMLPYLIVMLLFTGPMSLGIDAITGEKERGTMASMLVAPVKRREIVIGKILSLSCLSCLSALVYAVSIIISVPRMFNGMDTEGVAVSASFSILQMAELLVVMLSLVYFYVSVVVLIAVFAKTAKEAGTYVSPVYIVVIVAGVMTMFSGNSDMKLPFFAIPVYGSAAAIQRIITGELNVVQFGTAIFGTVLLSVLLTALITKAFNSEKVMFNA